MTARAASIDPAARQRTGGRDWSAVADASSRDGDTANLVDRRRGHGSLAHAEPVLRLRQWHPRARLGLHAPQPRSLLLPGPRRAQRDRPGPAPATHADARHGAGRRDVRYVLVAWAVTGRPRPSRNSCAARCGDDPQEAVAAPRFFVDPEAPNPCSTRAARPRTRAGSLEARTPTGVARRLGGDHGTRTARSVEPSGAFVGGGDPRTDGAVATW